MTISIRRVFFILMLMIFGIAAQSQTPAQFSGLLTTSTDYTCGGTVPCATWPMPPMPAPGGSYTDPTFGTTTWRLATPPANGGGIVMPAYSRVQAWNSDNTLMFVMDGGGGGVNMDLYDATTTPPTPINRITMSDRVGLDAGDNDALWAFTDPHRIYYNAGASTGHGLELRYVDVSACTPSSCVLTPHIIHTFSCATDATSNPEIGTGIAGNKIETGSGAQGGMFDNTDTYFSFTCDKVDTNGRHEIDFIRYNRLSDTVEHQLKWYTLCPGGRPQGCAAWWGQGQKAAGLIRMNQHPDHHYIAVIWQAGATNGSSGTSSPPTHINITGNVLTVTANNTLQVGTEAKFHNLSAASYLNEQFVIVTSATSTQFTAAYAHANDDQAITKGTITGLSCGINTNWVRGCGVEVFDDSYNFLGPAAPYPGHMDTGFDVNGIPVMVTVGSHHYDPLDERSIGIDNFTTLSTTAVTEKRIVLPCSFTRQPTCSGTFLGSKPGHISMTGTWGTQPGYALYSTMMVPGPAIGYPPTYPAPVALGTAVSGPGMAAVTPASMSQIGVGVVSMVDTGTNAEAVTWTNVAGNAATAAFAKAHASTAPVYSLSSGETGFGAMENFAVKIDANAPDSSNAVFWRIGRTMAIRDNEYNAEPHTAVNRDFTQIIWGSTWNVDPGNSGPVYGFWTKLSSPGTVQYALSTAAAGTGGGTITGCAQNYASGASYSCTVTPNIGSALTSVSGCGGSGTTTFSGTMPATNCTVTATFTALSLTGITVTPAAASIVAGTGTQLYAAKCSYSNGTTSDCTSAVTWSSSNLAAATITTGAVTSAVASGVTAGSTTIKATAGRFTGSSALTVRFGGKPVTLKSGLWAWIGGSSAATGMSDSQAQPYTTLGTPSAVSAPGGREAFVNWTDSTGNLWLFGGGFDTSGATGYLNDLWEFLPSTQKWVLVGGSSTVPAADEVRPGVYGALGTPAAGLSPGGREESASWTDKSGNLWLFGGIGYDSAGTNGILNDLWKFVPSNQEWAWMSGDSSIPVTTKGRAGVYGQLGVSAAGNTPGARWGASSWTDLGGNLWLFGGEGYDSAGSLGLLNDLWELDPSAGKWVWMAGSNTVGSGRGKVNAYGSFASPSTTNVPSARSQAVSWVDSTGNVWLFGGQGFDSTGTLGYLNDLWEFNPSTRKWAWMGGGDTVGCASCGMPGAYGTLGEADPANSPGGRIQAVGWTDSDGNLWIFGGSGYDSTGKYGILNDLWEFSPSTQEWAWMGGSSTVSGALQGEPGTYGPMGVPSAGTAPGSRWGTGGWTDSNGNLWLFGGEGYDSSGAYGNLNDLWVYQPSPGSLPAAVPNP